MSNVGVILSNLLIELFSSEQNVNICYVKISFGFDGWRVARFLKQVKDRKVDDE